ncbi:hypothetical protein [Rhizobium mesoamericanum]|nr:hypothetical protein [Rhizobium mesoamericanum]
MASELYEIGAIKNGIDSVDPVEAAKEAPLQARVNGAEELAQSGDTAYLVIGDLASARDLRLS